MMGKIHKILAQFRKILAQNTDFMTTLRNIFAYLWQLPQNLVGLAVLAYYTIKDGAVVYTTNEGGVVNFFPSCKWSRVSLGRYIFLRGEDIHYRLDFAHEYGHSRQSQMLGWLYLPIVGLWSGIRCGLHLYQDGHYYDCWVERWADRLGGVKRDEDGRRYV